MNFHLCVTVSEYNLIVLSEKYNTIKCKIYNYYLEIFLGKKPGVSSRFRISMSSLYFHNGPDILFFFSRQNWLVFIVTISQSASFFLLDSSILSALKFSAGTLWIETLAKSLLFESGKPPPLKVIVLSSSPLTASKPPSGTFREASYRTNSWSFWVALRSPIVVLTTRWAYPA